MVALMEERLELLKLEVEGRGFRWDGGEKGDYLNGGTEPGENMEMVDTNEDVNGMESGNGRAVVGMNEGTEIRVRETARGGSLGDEELMRRLRERMVEEDIDDGGLHI